MSLKSVKSDIFCRSFQSHFFALQGIEIISLEVVLTLEGNILMPPSTFLINYNYGEEENLKLIIMLLKKKKREEEGR